MTKPTTLRPAFSEGEEVVLTENNYLDSQGSRAVFLRLREDSNWADITTRTGSVHSYPVVWLARAEA